MPISQAEPCSQPHWPVDQLSTSPWLVSLRPVLAQLDWHRFPDLDDWAAVPAALQPATQTGLPLRFVAPDDTHTGYELRIAQHGEVPTRAHNWHDAFNALCWLAWPRSKAALNAWHLDELARQPDALRTPARDAATLMDESGIVLAVADPALGEALLAHDWHTLFLARRDDWGRSIQAFVLGHALMEKSLAPFRGIVAKVALMPVPPDWFAQPLAQQMQDADSWLAGQLAQRRYAKPRDLPAMPVLGIPGWWPVQSAAFYADTGHFRPKRVVVHPG